MFNNNQNKSKNAKNDLYKITGRDVELEKAVGKRSHKTIAISVVFAAFVFSVFLLITFVKSGFVISADVIYFNGISEIYQFCVMAGIIIGAIPTYMSAKTYIHPDSELKNMKSTDADILDEMLSEGEKVVRGMTIFKHAPKTVINAVYKKNSEAAEYLQKYFSENNPTKLKTLLLDKKLGILPPTLLAGAPFPYNLENRALFCIGSAGSGKSQVIKELIYNIRKRGGRDRFVIYDRKPEYLPIFYQDGDRIICPADLRHTPWDLFAEMDGEQDVDGVIKSLIPSSSNEKANERFWVESARNVFKATLVYLMEESKENYKDAKAKWERNGSKPDEEPVYKKPTNEDLVKFMSVSMSNPAKYWGYLKTYKSTEFLGQSLSAAEKPNSPATTVNSVLSSLGSYASGFTRPEVAEAGDFSIRKWLVDPKTEGQAIFLANPAKYGDNYESYFTVILNIALNEMISIPNDNDRRVWFIIDEFGSLMKLGTVVRLLAEGRSKGACTIIGTQDIAQIKNKYGDENKTIINNCNSQCIARVTDHEEAKYLTDIIGEVEVEKEESDASMDIGHEVSFRITDKNNSTRREKRQAMLPTELSNLPDLTYICKASELGWYKGNLSNKYYNWNSHTVVKDFIPKPITYFDTSRLFLNNKYNDK